jgi:hypothetical protein
MEAEAVDLHIFAYVANETSNAATANGNAFYADLARLAKLGSFFIFLDVQQRSRPVLDAIVADMRTAVAERLPPASKESEVASAAGPETSDVTPETECDVDATTEPTPLPESGGELQWELKVFEETTRWCHVLQSEILIAQLIATTPTVAPAPVDLVATAAAAAVAMATSLAALALSAAVVEVPSIELAAVATSAVAAGVAAGVVAAESVMTTSGAATERADMVASKTAAPAVSGAAIAVEVTSVEAAL